MINNINIPVEFISFRYAEEKEFVKTYTKDEARSLAGKRALESVEAQLPEDIKVIGTELQEVETGGQEDIVRMKALVETIEEIGVGKPHRTSGGGSDLVGGKH